MNLRQLSAFVGVYEEGSFSAAARRLAATQSGLSMQIKNLEDGLGARLFDRTSRGVAPTYAGAHLYGVAVEILHRLDAAETELRGLGGVVAGPLAVGLMPTFTRGLLAPVLADFLDAHPMVALTVTEAYSAALVDKTVAGEVDFAVVPFPVDRDGLRTRALGTDREILVRRPGGPVPHLAPVRLADLAPLKLVLPLRGNARRGRLEAAFADLGLPPATIVDMDAMIATLDFVASSDFATILPATICSRDLDGARRWLHPIVGPALTVSYAVVSPATRALGPAATAFLDRFEAEYARSDAEWTRIVAAADAIGHRST